MEGCDEGVVSIVEKGERLGAVGVGLVVLDRVVDNGVGMQMLCLLAEVS